MKIAALVLCALLTLCARGSDRVDLSREQLQAKVEQVNAAQNRVTRRGSTMPNADRLFALYADDFTYMHEAYGGTYSRDELYRNTVRNLEAGRYTLDGERHTILRTIAGRNAVAVERREHSGTVHLSVFEFEGGRVSRIVEYWKIAVLALCRMRQRTGSRAPNDPEDRAFKVGGCRAAQLQSQVSIAS